MKEGISYSFLLNIIILFISVCGAIVAGIFSYYRAFRANLIITHEIEKYEGYNCESMDAISKKLKTISYNVPFNVKCKDKYGKACMTDDSDNGNYAVVAYNVDYSSDKEDQYAFSNVMDASCNSSKCTKFYQYGVYTYMYFDIPVLSTLAKIPVFSKTRLMYDFRNLVRFTDVANNYDFIDTGLVPSDIVDSDIEVSGYLDSYNIKLLDMYANSVANGGFYSEQDWGSGKKNSSDYNMHDAYLYSDVGLETVQTLLNDKRFSCGHKFDWSAF